MTQTIPLHLSNETVLPFPVAFTAAEVYMNIQCA